MAMGLFRKKVSDLSGWRIESAGTWTIQGQPAASYTLQVLQHRGIDIYDHRSRPVNRELLAQFNLILTMESGHKEALRIEFPEFTDRIFMLSEMIGEVSNIPDPMGGSIDEFIETAGDFERIFDQGFENILQYAGT